MSPAADLAALEICTVAAGGVTGAGLLPAAAGVLVATGEAGAVEMADGRADEMGWTDIINLLICNGNISPLQFHYRSLPSAFLPKGVQGWKAPGFSHGDAEPLRPPNRWKLMVEK